MLPEAHVVFIDEVWRGNSAINNAFLPILNECRYKNIREWMDCPLRLAVGATNSLPQSDDLGAIYDRWVLRYFVDYISDDDNFRKILLGKVSEDIKSTITLDELDALREFVKSVEMPIEVEDMMVEVRHMLRENGIVRSERRWNRTTRVVKALAVVRGRNTVRMEDLEIIGHTMWDDPSEEKLIFNLLMPKVNPYKAKAREYKDAAVEVWDGLKDDPVTMRQVHTELKTIREKIKKETRDRDKMQVAPLFEVGKWIDARLKEMFTMKMERKSGALVE
jgi:MoxR-like ATPase